MRFPFTRNVRPSTICLTAILTFSSGFAHADVIGTSLHKSRSTPLSAQPARENSPVYHNGVTLVCADCHVMHESKQHALGEEQSPDPFGSYPQMYGTAPTLLKRPDPIELCLTCHDNVAGIPDVLGPDVNGLLERSAGFFEPAGLRNPKGHSLGYGLEVGDFELCMRCHFGGTFADASVTCIDCHAPHGNARPRNLQWASFPSGEPQFGLLEANSSGGMQKYEAANVAYGTDNTDNLREVTNMCIDCHHVVSGDSYTDPDGSGWHNRHPSYESERLSSNSISQGGARQTTDPTHWESGVGSGFDATPRLRFVNSAALNFADAMLIDADANGVFCLTCHKAHGSENAFGLRWSVPSGPAGDGCDQCHAKAGS